MISSLTDFYRSWNKEELFNLHHASAWNIIKCIFGVIKRKYHILLIPPEYNTEIQARIPASLAAVHNFIHCHQLEEEEEIDKDDDAPIGGLVDVDDNDDAAELADIGLNEPDTRRDGIATAMWDQYIQEHIFQGLPLPGVV